MICDASFPTFFLKRWAGETAGEHRISIEEAVAALTSEPADMSGLGDRGRIVVGAKADINVIDMAALDLGLPEVVKDLPAGGRRLRQLADGYSATIVSGVVTYRGGEPTGELPGRPGRGTRPLATLPPASGGVEPHTAGDGDAQGD